MLTEYSSFDDARKDRNGKNIDLFRLKLRVYSKITRKW